jgi:Rps23 Pro-64 3,4-dihydroxylase Tpa1-like proline 4-hydroxylase
MNLLEGLTEEELKRIEAIPRRLDAIRLVTEINYWVSTEELGVLLQLSPEAIAFLKSQKELYEFQWRNLTCILSEIQNGVGYWTIRLRNSRRAAPPKLEDGVAADPDRVYPSVYAQIKDFLTWTELRDLFRYVIAQEGRFKPTTTTAPGDDPGYRQSQFISHFPEFSELMVQKIMAVFPRICQSLDLEPFEVGTIESQLTAHNDQNYYKVHNDNGSADTASRELTYVYYFHREPKAFTGGELVIYDSKIKNNYYVAAESYKKVTPLNNSIVFFLSRYMHEVLPVSCPSQSFADGRFTINGWLRKKPNTLATVTG